MALETYLKKRDFQRTHEPRGKRVPRRASGLRFIVQKHAATHLHYDFRLELDGVLLSWAVPKGPSLDPTQRRLAVHVEDHPLEYGNFEGTIPKGEYGGGSVLLWDRGEWFPRKDPREGMRKGHLVFDLVGEKLRGGWALLRMGGSKEPEGKNWLLVKEKDDEARTGRGADITERAPESVASGKRIEEIGSKSRKVWHSNRSAGTNASPSRTAATGPRIDLSGLTGARRSDLPKRVAPQLAMLVPEVPEGSAWLHEIKYDGFRTQCEVTRGKVRLLTRNGLQKACARGLEGVVSKRAGGTYVSGRTDEWVKTKCSARQEFVIGGFTDPKGARSGLGSLLLGAKDDGHGLRYCGRVGTGFTQDMLRMLRRRLGTLKADSSPFTNPPRLPSAHWVKPELVAEVSFSSWTDDGMLRHPSLEGLREDKPARDVVIETPHSTRSRSGSARTAPKSPRRRGPRVPPKPPRRPPPVRDPGRRTPVREPPAEDPPRAPIREPPEEGKEHPVAGVTLTHPGKVSLEP